MQASHNNVETVVGDGHHRADAAHSENGSRTGVEFAHKGTKEPDSTSKGIEDKHRKLSEHHAEIGKSQVDDEHVGGRSQFFRFHKQVQHQRVSCRLSNN